MSQGVLDTSVAIVLAHWEPAHGVPVDTRDRDFVGLDGVEIVLT